MTPQLKYALRRVAIMIGLAVLGVLGVETTGVIDVAGLDPTIWGPIAGAIIAGAVRTIEGYRDGQRAESGEVIKEDVKPLPKPEERLDVKFDYEFL